MRICQPFAHVGRPQNQPVAVVQSFSGEHYALVRVTGQDGDATGDLMYVRYCGDCYRGYPLHLFAPGNAVCTRCTARSRARPAAAVRAPAVVDESVDKWATPAAALVMEKGGQEGLCCAVGCVQPAQRRGETRAANVGAAQRPYPLCAEHMKVRAYHMLCCAPVGVGRRQHTHRGAPGPHVCGLQAWFCKWKGDDLKVRYCMSHRKWETAVGFGGFFRTCTGRLYPVVRAEAEATEARVEQETLTAATPAATSAVVPPEVPAWPQSWGRQTAVVDSQDACAQVRSYLQAGVGPWVKALTGDTSTTDAAVTRAVHAVVDQLQAQPSGAWAAGGVPLHSAVAPTTCARCGHPTAARAFVGQSTCIICAARGGLHLSLIEANQILVTGVLSGRGAWLCAVLPRHGCMALQRLVHVPPWHTGLPCLCTIVAKTSCFPDTHMHGHELLLCCREPRVHGMHWHAYVGDAGVLW